MLILPSFPGTHEGDALDILLILTANGCVILSKLVILHPFASLALTVYTFALNPLNEPVVLFVPLGKSVYVIVPLPPDAATLILAFDPPKQLTLVEFVRPQTNCVGCVITNVVLVVHPFASVTVTVYVPANFPVKTPVLFTIAPGCNVYEYATVPPVALVLILPVAVPLHVTGVVVALTQLNAARGCVITLRIELVHPAMSFTVTV